MSFRTKLDFSDNRQVKQRPETFTQLSGGTSFGVPFSALTSGPDTSTSAVTQTLTSLSGTFSGNSGTTNYVFSDSRMQLGVSALSALTPSNSGTTQFTGPVFTSNTTTVIDGNTVVLTYSGVSYDLTVTAMTSLGGGNYSGSVATAQLSILSAGTLDFSGRTIWVDVSGITRTNDLILSNNPIAGYVWTCIDSEGKGGWVASSGGTGSSSFAKYTITTGLTSGITVTVPHNLNTTDILLQVKDLTSNELIELSVDNYQLNSVDITSTVTMASSRIIILAAGGTGSSVADLWEVGSGSGSIQTKGNSANASGLDSFAAGSGATASDSRSIAIGYNSNANGIAAIGIGLNSSAVAQQSIAIGPLATANGVLGVAIGLNATADGVSSYAIGEAANASGIDSFAIGHYALSPYDKSVALGYSAQTLSSNTMSFGYSGYTAYTFNGTSKVYLYNLNIANVGATAFVNDIRIDANGNLTTNTSDRTLKENIKPLTNALDIIKGLNGVTYQWKDRNAGGDSVKIGFIAQEVEKVDSRLTFVNKPSGLMGIHSDNIIPLLVEAVKELATGSISIKNSELVLETQTIVAEDNNIELNFNGTNKTAIGGGITVLHGMGQDKSSVLSIDKDGNWTTNNDFKPNAFTIPTYTPFSSADDIGTIGNVTRDNNYLYIRSENGWGRIKLESF